MEQEIKQQEKEWNRRNWNQKKLCKTTALITAVCILILVISILVRILAFDRKEAEIVYKETTAEYGKLTVGITESGNVEVGTTQQEFGLDISAYAGSQSSQGDAFPWAGMGGNLLNVQSSQTSSGSDSRNLTVEEVYVSVGQEIQEGDPIYRLSKESVEELREELSEDVTAAKLELEQVRTQMKKINLSAAHDYETDVTYGNAAQLEYDETIDQLQEAYDTAVEKLEEAREELEELQTKEQELMAKLEESKHLYDETTYRTDYIDKEDDPYGYISTLTLRDTIEATRDSDEDALEEKQDAIDKKKEEIETLEKELKTAEKEMRSGAVTAKASYDTRVLRLEKGKQIYDLSVGIGEQDYAEAEDAYAEAKEKLEEFDRCIQDCNVISDSSGVITEIGLEAGDTLSRGMSLITLKDYGKTGITVTVGDDDIDKIAVGDTANISITAFPDMQFYGTVTEIGDAQVNTYSSAITYEVTVDIEGDVDGIYSGMTSEVTFITKETKEVLYVSNRAIKRDGSRSYVYIHDEEGNVTEKDVETGFSDGINVEIKEGLSNGETVLIESKVNGE